MLNVICIQSAFCEKRGAQKNVKNFAVSRWVAGEQKKNDRSRYNKTKKRADKNKIPRVSVESEMNGGQ